jgi:hypothetical protein
MKENRVCSFKHVDLDGGGARRLLMVSASSLSLCDCRSVVDAALLLSSCVFCFHYSWRSGFGRPPSSMGSPDLVLFVLRGGGLGLVRLHRRPAVSLVFVVVVVRCSAIFLIFPPI